MKCETCDKPLYEKDEVSVFFKKCVNVECENCDPEFKIVALWSIPIAGKLSVLTTFFEKVKEYAQEFDLENMREYLERVLIIYYSINFAYKEIDMKSLEGRPEKKWLEKFQRELNKMEGKAEEVIRKYKKEEYAEIRKITAKLEQRTEELKSVTCAIRQLECYVQYRSVINKMIEEPWCGWAAEERYKKHRERAEEYVKKKINR